MKMGKWLRIGALVGAIAIAKQYGGQLGLGLGLDKDAALRLFQQWSDRLGIWAIPLYVALHTLTLSLCLPYAVFFEAGASLLFGFFPAVLCVFSAKLLGASLSFWIGRAGFQKFKFCNGLGPEKQILPSPFPRSRTRWLEICPSCTILSHTFVCHQLCSSCHKSWICSGFSASYCYWLSANDLAEHFHRQPCWCCCCDSISL
ncbi:SNARE associated Golgi protein family isoform 2 [Theobroma cacao]|uniref:SNARE associated Golgi protein family isoform 2 n=1 Tax=Theobroma cacao TaxID=3641 RepID=A0A061DW12_THECC|nr:SNARE associated Golgi protein family isoform 2 [Theobroma cacao]